VIRVVVTILIAGALLAVAFPVIDHEAADRSDAEARAAIQSIDDAATDLARTEEAVPGEVGARRSVTVDLPERGIASSAVEHLTISPDGYAYSYQVAGRSPRTVRGRTPVHTLDGEPLALRGDGRHELVLALVDEGGERRVVIARLGAVRSGALGGATG